jgi:hypothetical protein
LLTQTAVSGQSIQPVPLAVTLPDKFFVAHISVLNEISVPSYAVLRPVAASGIEIEICAILRFMPAQIQQIQSVEHPDLS